MDKPIEPLARAHAILGLRLGASPRDVARRYKRLVRRWHPDQYTNDPQGLTEATQRMRAINDAYRFIQQSRNATSRLGPSTSPAGRGTGQPVHRKSFAVRLTESEIREIAAAIGTRGMAERFGRYALWGGCVVFGLLLLGYGGRAGRRSPRPDEALAGVVLLVIAATSFVRQTFFKKED